MSEPDMHQRMLDFASGVPGVDVVALIQCLEISRIGRRVHNLGDSYVAQFGLSTTRFTVLETLFHHPRGCVTPAELADEVGLSRAAMTAALDGLERKDYVVRSQHPDDRRMVEIHLTDSGRCFMNEMLPLCYRDMTRMLVHLTEEERKIMPLIYRKVLKGMKEVLEMTE